MFFMKCAIWFAFVCSSRRVRKFDPAANEHLPKDVDLARARTLVRLGGLY
jgi:hypothetical protein